MKIQFKTFVSIIVFGVVLAVLGISIATTIQQTKQIKTLTEQNTTLMDKNGELNKNLKLALEKTAISFSINPEITNKVTSTFGSTKHVTFQYYFTLDGQAMITQPDSTYHILKEYN